MTEDANYAKEKLLTTKTLPHASDFTFVTLLKMANPLPIHVPSRLLSIIIIHKTN